ncbi:ATP-binding protein [Vibrio tapetis subsp. quintayensis]|uniref:sensor histidine kinase n=1 Tax=Vibrio tapetis TaxID=52443 RepID=UPI0025B2B8AB|nr:ATP-binding protein [Vibrio tapetis]MDN3682237.1 ATP-binding protein [Vibrio tapetis subsp. quintayensis]
MAVRKRVSMFFFVIYFFSTLIVTSWVWQSGNQQLSKNALQQAEQLKSHLSSQLDKYAYIPQLMSKDRELIDALLKPNNSAQLDITNRYLEQVNQIIGASDTYLIDNHGTTISASNWDNQRTFIGRNFAFRPYFQKAINGQKGEYFALGSTSGRRGYYYAYPIVFAAKTLGVIVVKKELSNIEQNWTNKESYFAVTDENNVVFMSNRESWLYQSIIPLSIETKVNISESRRYLEREIGSLMLAGDLSSPTSEITHTVNPSLNNQYLSAHQPMDNIDLTVRVLTPKIQLMWSVAAITSIYTLIFVLMYLSYVVYIQHRTKQKHIERIQQDAKHKLEFQVMERTAELHHEVKVRTETEHTLRQTQDELIQAAKLAVLGQMSASISHELNNPLAAIRSYADNGKAFLEKGKPEKTSENLVRISALTDRMAQISKQLKAFAKKSNANELVDAQIFPLIVAAKELLKAQLKNQRVELLLEIETELIQTKINPIQLEQVLVNLLSNAIHAIEQQPTKKIIVSLSQSDHEIVIRIEDNGPGIAQDHLNRLFDPFFTTKQNGLGLGLSISQQIVAGMHGALMVRDSTIGGACFQITLPNNSNPLLWSNKTP